MKLSKQALEAEDSLIRQMSIVAEQVTDPFKLYFGESDLSTPEFICNAAHKALLEGHTFYTPTNGSLNLREAIAEKFLEIHNSEYLPDEIACTGGAVMAIFLAVRSLVDTGDNVVIVEPTWPVFASIVTLMGATPRRVSLDENKDGFSLDIERIQHSIDERTRMLIINSPGNPTGWVISSKEQEALWSLSLEHDFVILADEVYDRIVFDRPVAQSFASVATDHDHIVIVNSFSKTYNMTGWRLGYALANNRLVELMAKLEEFIISNPPAMAQQAGITALREGESYVAEIRKKYASRRKIVIDKLQAIPQVSLSEPIGGFYAFPKLEGLTHSLPFAKKLLLEARVGMVPGIAFGQSGEGHMRLCFAASEDVLIPALANFKSFIEQNL